jgi:tetratricopeptide (TPR) repeat protein
MGAGEPDRLLQEGIAAARAGQRERARDLLLQVIAQDENVEAAWLWLSGVVDDAEERQICLENVLALNPDNAAAKKGLAWIAAQNLPPPVQPVAPSYAEPPAPPKVVLRPVPEQPSRPEPAPAARSRPSRVEIDPFGCPYCGGPVGEKLERCDFCGHSTLRRLHQEVGGGSLGWLVFFFILLAVAAAVEGLLVFQLTQMSQLPQWLGQTALQLIVGSALFDPAGAPADLAILIIAVDGLLAGLCLVAALGLALKSRAVYFGSFLLVGMMIVATGVGVLAGLIGWGPALLRLGLVILSIKWLMDCSAAFEWETRHYNAEVDHDLQTDMDYYSRGQTYRELGMWAKAAAHWQVASQLAPRQSQYHVALANAYVKMEYPRAALAEADKALALLPEDGALRAFRDALAEVEEKD